MMTRAVGTLTPGTLLYQGRYRIDLLLATTPHRAIYRAWNLARGRASTIIELAPSTDQQATRALERAAPLVQLDHPALTGFQVVFVEQETVFIGMAFAGGQLVDRIMDERIAPIQPAAAVRWVSQAAEMLEFFAGSLPSWHLGDLSPTALFVTVEDRTQLLGFEAPLGLLTPTEIAAGLPPGSVAPELRNGQCDARSDVYSLAASLYLLLTRQHWQGGDPATETALGAVEPALPPALIDVVRRGLAVDPAQRWQDAATFNSALLGVMAAPADSTNGNWWESMPAEPESDTQEIQRVDIAAAAPPEIVPPLVDDPAHADPGTTLDRVPSHIFTDAAEDLDPTTKQRAITMPPADETALPETLAATGAALGEAALIPSAADTWLTPTDVPLKGDAPVEDAQATDAGETVAPTPDEVSTPADAVFSPNAETAEAAPSSVAAVVAPIIAPALLDSLAASSGEIDPHGLEDMQPIDHSVVLPEESAIAAPPVSVAPPVEEATVEATPAVESPATEIFTPTWGYATGDAPTNTPDVTAETPADVGAEATLADAPVAVEPPAEDASATTSTPTDASQAPPVEGAQTGETLPSPDDSSSTSWLGWAAAGAAGVAGAAVAAATLHPDEATAEDASATVASDAAAAAPDATPAAWPEEAPPPSGTATYVPSWASTPDEVPAPTEPAPYVPWGYRDALSSSPTDAEVTGDALSTDTDVHTQSETPSTPAPIIYPWGRDDDSSHTEAVEDVAAPEAVSTVAPESASEIETPPTEPQPDEATPADTNQDDPDQLNAWTRFAESVSPSTITQAASAFAGWSAVTSPATETDPLPAPTDGATETAATMPATTAIDPPTHPVAATPFTGQTISAHSEQRYEPNIPPPSARSKTPSRPLANNPFFNRIRDLLGAAGEPSAALGTVVLPRHMYPQHSYSILVRLQTRTGTNVGEDKRMAIVEVEAPANAFYLPVRRLALPIPADGGLSEGTLSITALRPSPGNSDRIIFTFKQADGTILHKGAYVADVSILTAQQIANGEPMITLVHPLDIPA